MHTFEYRTETTFLTLKLEPQADVVQCILVALMAGLPAAIQAFLDCMSSQDPTDGGYKPGTRARCR